ncbi:MAG TPA: hypothetical protein VML35_04080 [Gaiellaceae bacterium]|nr:hypothetical protein [Gaiellaceae bacterium]
MKVKVFTLVAVSIVAAAMLAGCGGDDEGDGFERRGPTLQDAYDAGYNAAGNLLSIGAGNAALDICISQGNATGFNTDEEYDAYEQGCRDAVEQRGYSDDGGASEDDSSYGSSDEWAGLTESEAQGYADNVAEDEEALDGATPEGNMRGTLRGTPAWAFFYRSDDNSFCLMIWGKDDGGASYELHDDCSEADG